MRHTVPLQLGMEPFPGYRLGRLLGYGSFAEVGEAQGDDGSNIALKFLSAERPLATPDEIRSLQAVRKLLHPNLIRIERVWGGIPVLATGLVLLGAVPAAFQYGLWDSNTQDRCGRLELLLLTRLEARDYWQAAAAAAWNRGRGYFAVAVLLWIAALFGGKMSAVQVCAAVAGAVLLWSLYFTLGFRAFSTGMHANRLGLFLTVGVPLLGVASWKASVTLLSVFIPATSLLMGSVVPRSELLLWSAGPVATALLTLFVARRALRSCDSELRRWYELHHGRKVMS